MTTGKSSRATKHYSIVDLFAGPGGLDVAAHWLGIPVHGIEWDADACATRKAAGLSTDQADVRAVGPKDFQDATVLVGGPPCQTYTLAGGGAGRRALDQVLHFVKQMAAGVDVTAAVAALDDERTGLVLEPLRWIIQAAEFGLPYDAVVLEQVPAVLPVWQAMGEALAGLGYQVDCGVLRTEQYGVPQTRRRAILVAHRHRTPSLPAPTHRPYRKGVPRTEGDSDLLPWVTMEDVLDRDGGFVVVSNYGSGGDPRARGRRTSAEPAATVTGKVSRNRVVGLDGVELPRFTPAEAGRLQTFPEDYPWDGNAISQQIGNAIPPRLGAHVLASALGLSIDEHFFDAALSKPWRIGRWGLLTSYVE
ncbi:DNA cytosine methyltransferase [Rhodococcus gordoniae]|uniref:DNA cytosine methyltransferase n=1 Tax=Rhodococcus gordoniae TaxID=223392 RepID=UPI0020CB95DD|nr:DNA cytosine methyltransferase [Rhodococcus gordoniae]UTT49877.1 DNA cytosine methyltransferase [Rhodococcus gordoniae]